MCLFLCFETFTVVFHGIVNVWVAVSFVCGVSCIKHNYLIQNCAFLNNIVNISVFSGSSPVPVN